MHHLLHPPRHVRWRRAHSKIAALLPHGLPGVPGPHRRHVRAGHRPIPVGTVTIPSRVTKFVTNVSIEITTPKFNS